MPTTSNFGWTTPADTDLVKDGAAAIRTLGNGVDSSFVDLKGGTTGQVLSKASNTDLDFTWVAVDPLTILDAKGDLITATAADTPARLAVGTNGHVLTADSTESTGIKWAALPTSGGMTLIQETVASANSSISFSNISGDYKQLHLVYSGIRHSGTGSDFSVRFNNNSNSIYHINGPQFAAARAVNLGGDSPNNLRGQNSPANLFSFGTSVANANISTDCMGYIIIDNYASTTKAKTIAMRFNYYNSGDSEYAAVNTTGVFDSTSAITSVDIVRLSGSATITNTTNTSIRLYGVA